jgi:hypothetical protein
MTDEAEAGCKGKKPKKGKTSIMPSEDYSYQMVDYQLVKC